MLKKKKIWIFLLSLLLIFTITGCKAESENINADVGIAESDGIRTNRSESGLENGHDTGISKKTLSENGYYYDKDDVALYIHEFGKLPTNYITKKEASDIGWSVSERGDYVIGGDVFGNREGKLPEKKGRKYYECDLVEGYTNKRGASRIVFSDDGLIFYTNNHYDSFEQLY